MPKYFGVVLVLVLQGMIIAQRLIAVAVFTSLNHIFFFFHLESESCKRKLFSFVSFPETEDTKLFIIALLCLVCGILPQMIL